MTSDGFNRLIDATKAFVDKDHRNPCYNFIRFEFHADVGEVVAVALDGFRLSVEYGLAECEEDFIVYG